MAVSIELVGSADSYQLKNLSLFSLSESCIIIFLFLSLLFGLIQLTKEKRDAPGTGDAIIGMLFVIFQFFLYIIFYTLKS